MRLFLKSSLLAFLLLFSSASYSEWVSTGYITTKERDPTVCKVLYQHQFSKDPSLQPFQIKSKLFSYGTSDFTYECFYWRTLPQTDYCGDSDNFTFEQYSAVCHKKCMQSYTLNNQDQCVDANGCTEDTFKSGSTCVDRCSAYGTNANGYDFDKHDCNWSQECGYLQKRDRINLDAPDLTGSGGCNNDPNNCTSDYAWRPSDPLSVNPSDFACRDQQGNVNPACSSGFKLNSGTGQCDPKPGSSSSSSGATNSSTSSSGRSSSSSTSTSSSGRPGSSTSSSGGSNGGSDGSSAGSGSGNGFGSGNGDGDGEGTDYGPQAGIEPTDRAHSFYESKYEEGFKGVYADFSEKIENTSMAKSVNQFKTNFGSGTVPTFTICPPVVGCKSFEIDSKIWLFIKAVILFSAAVLCRSIIFGG